MDFDIECSTCGNDFSSYIYPTCDECEIEHDKQINNKIKNLEDKIKSVLEYCNNKTDFMWSASIVSILLDCGFRESKENLQKYFEVEKIKKEFS